VPGLCYTCHGAARKGVKGQSSLDIESVFKKFYRHPVDQTAMYYKKGEQLPETSSSAIRHVSCLNCHKPHVSKPGNTMADVKGYSPVSRMAEQTSQEYEVCFDCHSESANLPATSTNLALKFSPLNPSYHPVMAAGRNRNVPSLKNRNQLYQKILCTDCHGNSDSYGPKGPHGSDYEHILSLNYRSADGPETEQAYALCYSCHDRRSILADQSFKEHKNHIVFYATSCHTCHDAHGSRQYTNLISFNTLIVTNGSDGGPHYAAVTPGKPYCYLSCHNANHCISGIQSPGGVMKKWYP
jgi:hypothetical protein